MKSSTSISISTEESMDAAAAASARSSAAPAALPILKSTETRTLLPGLKKRQSIRRSPSPPPSHSRVVPGFTEFAVFLAAVCLFMGLNMYMLDGRDSHHASDGKAYYSLMMQRGLLRATTTASTGQHFQEEDFLTGTDAQWMQQTMHGDNHGLRQLYEHDDENNTMPEKEKANGSIRGPTTTAHMDLP